MLAGCGRFGFVEGQPADAARDDIDLLADEPVGTGLIGFWQFEDDFSDSTTTDEAGGHDATCPQGLCPARMNGPRGTALDCGNQTRTMVIADAPEFHSSSGTVAAWVRPRLEDGLGAVASKAFGLGALNSWELGINVDEQSYAFTGATDADQILMNGSTVVDLAQWVHLAVRWDGTTFALFLGGALELEMPHAVTFDTHPILICGDADSGTPTSGFAGQMDELRIYDRALSDAELAALAVP